MDAVTNRQTKIRIVGDHERRGWMFGGTQQFFKHTVGVNARKDEARHMLTFAV